MPPVYKNQKYIYKVDKSSIGATVDKLTGLSESEISSFFQKQGGMVRYYPAQVGENTSFYTSPSNVATSFKFDRYASSHGPSNVSDPVRRLCGLFWTQEELQKDQKVDLTISNHIAYFRSVVDEHNIPMSANFTSYRKSSESALSSEEWVILGVNQNMLSKPGDYHSILQSELPGTVYEDFSVSLP